MSNRHEWFLDKLESRLAQTPTLNVLKSFDVGTWREAGKFPYCHVYAEDAIQSYAEYENGFNDSELYALTVSVFVGYEKTEGNSKGAMAREGLRVCSLVEKALTNYEIPDYKTDTEIAHAFPVRYARLQRSIDDDRTKGLAMVGFIVNYQYTQF